MPGALGRIWTCVASLSVGIVFGESHEPGPWAIAGVLTGGAACLCLRRRRVTAAGGLVLVSAAAGALAAGRLTTHSTLQQVARAAPTCEFDGRIHEHLGGLGTLIALDRARCDGHHVLRGAGLVVVDEPTGDPGAAVAGRGLLASLGDEPFDRQRARLGALAVLYPDEVRIGRVRAPPLAVAAAIRRALVRATGSLQAQRAGLVRGLTTGDVSGLDPVTIERFRRAGLSHLLAVSGSNVAIVLGALGVVVRGLGPRRKLALSGLALVIFVLVVGPEPSVLRAAAMGAISLAALAWGRRSEPLHALGVALIIVLGLRPGMVYMVGLHLSAAATVGIVLWGERIASGLGWLPRWVALGCGATIAAQVAVAPVLIVAFGRLSVAGPAANLLALPAVPPATILGVVAGVVGTAAPGVGALAARLADPLAGWILSVGAAFGDAGWASVELPRSAGWVAAAPVVVAAMWSVVRPGDRSGRSGGTSSSNRPTNPLVRGGGCLP